MSGRELERDRWARWLEHTLVCQRCRAAVGDRCPRERALWAAWKAAWAAAGQESQRP